MRKCQILAGLVAMSCLSFVGTQPSWAQTTTFAVIGDYGTDDTRERDVANLVNGWNPAFIITGGDNNYVNDYNRAVENHYGQYTSSNCASNRFWPSIGNHDDNLTAYFNFFNCSVIDRFYTFTKANVQFFVLDSDNPPSGQTTWLRDALRQSTAEWKVVYFHHSAFSSGRHGDDRRMQLDYAGWGADIVFSGHDHIYERINRNGIHYIVNGLGGRSLYNFDNCCTSGSQVRYNSNWGAVRVDVDGSEMRVRFISLDRSTVDDFTLMKGSPPPPPPPPSTGLQEDFEGDVAAWSVSGLWHLVNDSNCGLGFSSPTRAFYYGRDSNCNYDTGAANSGNLVSPDVEGITADSTLNFRLRRQVENFNGNFDRTAVDISSDGGSSWTTVFSQNSSNASQNTWIDGPSIPLANFAGSPIRIRFRFESGDNMANDFVGWFVDDVVVTTEGNPPPPDGCTVAGFESGATGWVTDSASTCTTGAYVRGTPTEQISSGVTTQVNGANSGANALFTATNTAPGTNDVDNGNCILTSPSFDVPDASTLSVAYFHGQRDSGDDATGDFFRLELSTDGGTSFSTIAANGDSASNAVWEAVSQAIPANSNVVLRLQCSDGSGMGDLIECGIDDLTICPMK